MNRKQRIAAFAALGEYLRDLSSEELTLLINNAANENPWFTPQSVKQSITGISSWLTRTALDSWTSGYPEPSQPRTVALVMAGNIPLVGFHDLLAVLISGHSALIKLSSKDRFLPSWLIEKLVEIEPAFERKITIAEQLKSFDAVIATGSDNSARYFNYYFAKYPHIIRKNRSSIAVLSGDETQNELQSLGKDIFTYFGLGCRNVSKVMVPPGYEFDAFFRSIESYSPVFNHHKYANNYDYQKSILLINSERFLDNGFLLLQESDKIVSPISVLFYERYNSTEELAIKLLAHREKTQVVIGNLPPLTQVPFGLAQQPSLIDYADNVDTMTFLAAL